MATENQRKAADLIRMMREGGVTNVAEELEAIIAEAWDEGVELNGGDRLGQTNPYRGRVR